MDVIEQLAHLVELAVVFGLAVATAFGVANLIAGVIVTLRE
jgi:hypothetical protein